MQVRAAVAHAAGNILGHEGAGVVGAARAAGIPVRVRRHEGYDHSYYFIATFVADHIEHHARVLS